MEITVLLMGVRLDERDSAPPPRETQRENVLLQLGEVDTNSPVHSSKLEHRVGNLEKSSHTKKCYLNWVLVEELGYVRVFMAEGKQNRVPWAQVLKLLPLLLLFP